MTGPITGAEVPAPRPYGAPPPPTPGVVPLRPLRIGEILAGAFATMRRYPAPMLGIAALVMAVVAAVEVPATYAVLSAAGDHTTIYAAVVALLGGISYLLLTGVATAVVGQAVLGRPIAVRAVWTHLRPVLGSLAAVTLVVFLVPALVVATAVVPVVALTDPSAEQASALAVIAIVASIGIAAWLFITWSFAPAVVVLERQPAGAALRRSQTLVRRSWWRVFLVVLLAQIIAAVVAGVVSAPFAGNGDLLDPGADVSFGSVALRGLGGFIAGALTRPFTAGVTALLYIDRRMRVESLDTTLQNAAETGSVAGPS